MHTEWQESLNLFTANATAMHKAFPWRNDGANRLAALACARQGKAVDAEAVRRCLVLIKESTNAFSGFRGDMQVYLAARLSLHADPGAFFSEAQRAHDLLKAAKFSAMNYRAIAAMQLAELCDPARFDEIAARAKAFYDGMKRDHFWLTGNDDTIVCVLLALSNLSVDDGLFRMEGLYQQFKPSFNGRNNLQALAQVLTLGGEGAADRLLPLDAALKAIKTRMDQAFTLPALGVLALLSAPAEEIAATLREMEKYLHAQKGFGSFVVGKQLRLLYAAGLLLREPIEGLPAGVFDALVVGSTITQQMHQAAAVDVVMP
ncbi:MAG: DUF4003 domain-containing protein [Oscillospiraceae bacterium]|jgi:hypothetical protein|nr:DUF4003 domain-containing protein [Oscillospiraceae bacterium]